MRRGLCIRRSKTTDLFGACLLRDAELLLLDDSLSAVDAKTEQAIIDTIQKERKDKTTIIVSHRLSAVHQADWIIVLDQGQIVEEGRG